MTEKSKVLVIGGTGYIGKFIVEVSAKFGHPTFALVRDSALSSPAKAIIVEGFESLGVHLLHGDTHDQESLLNAIKQVDVAISAVGIEQREDQDRNVSAHQCSREYQDEFGGDVDRAHAVEPVKALLAMKAKICRLVEAEGIPYTYVCSNCFAGHLLPTLSQPGATFLPRDKVVILGVENAKVLFNREDDIGTYTIKAVDDPRTLNKFPYIKPPANTYLFNDLVSLWERKIGMALERGNVPEEQVLKNIQVAPLNAMLAIFHSYFTRGDKTNFEVEPSFGVEASEL